MYYGAEDFRGGNCVSRTNGNGSCLARVRGQLSCRPKCLARIARFVLRSPKRARSMTIRNLADACDTSAATVTRFCRALGYGGYKEFQFDLVAALVETNPPHLEDFTARASPRVIFEQVFACNRQSLLETAKILDSRTLARVGRLLLAGTRVFFLGLGGSGMLARDAAQRFLSLGLTAVAIADPYDQVFVADNSRRGDVLFGISHTGQSTHVVEAIRRARRRHASTVALTNYPQSPLAKVSELHLITAFPERRINAAVSSSRIAQMCVIDSLYFIVANWRGQAAMRLAAEAEKSVRQMLRFRVTGSRSRNRNRNQDKEV